MISQKRILAARANGARSRGPKTPEGKARSSRNALRHGLLANIVLLGSESPSSFQALFELHIQRFSPVDDVELGFIEEMTAAYWRMRRAWAIETRMLRDTMEARPDESELSRVAGAFGDLADTPKLALLQRYETRLHLMYQRALHNLLLLRNSSVRNEPRKSRVSRAGFPAPTLAEESFEPEIEPVFPAEPPLPPSPPAEAAPPAETAPPPAASAPAAASPESLAPVPPPRPAAYPSSRAPSPAPKPLSPFADFPPLILVE